MNSQIKHFFSSKLIITSIALLVVVIGGFIAYRWYMISHPYTYITFQTYKPQDKEITDINLELWYYKQQLFDTSFLDENANQNIILSYDIPTLQVTVRQYKDTSTDPSTLCSAALDEQCEQVVSAAGQHYNIVRTATTNTSAVQEIFLKKDSTLIEVSTDSSPFSDEQWRHVANEVFDTLEPHTFNESSYRFIERPSV